jgi:hypothetical protein
MACTAYTRNMSGLSKTHLPAPSDELDSKQRSKSTGVPCMRPGLAVDHHTSLQDDVILVRYVRLDAIMLISQSVLHDMVTQAHRGRAHWFMHAIPRLEPYGTYVQLFRSPIWHGEDTTCPFRLKLYVPPGPRLLCGPIEPCTTMSEPYILLETMRAEAGPKETCMSKAIQGAGPT